MNTQEIYKNLIEDLDNEFNSDYRDDGTEDGFCENIIKFHYEDIMEIGWCDSIKTFGDNTIEIRNFLVVENGDTTNLNGNTEIFINDEYKGDYMNGTFYLGRENMSRMYKDGTSTQDLSDEIREWIIKEHKQIQNRVNNILRTNN